ncbi:hypothetical protein PORY_000746 [Pneumocystis oryctolagi]|uniref:Uncharacterized protein n=1 Tax=Pneumocystis oryctolagi TaxID=42067 RepID=A0ACB7CDI8_9ASCO|nr:hypothetical protein PORY_000746 [Pneumocystis oryctolagi]
MAEAVIFKDTPLDIGHGNEAENKIKTIFQSYYTFCQQKRSKKKENIHSGILLFSYQSQALLCKVYSLVSTFLKTYLSEAEKSMFLERFRYIICTSQLLNENVSPSLYHSQQSSTSYKKNSHKSLRMLIQSAKKWFFSGGCIVALIFSIKWSFKKDIYQINKKLKYFSTFLICVITMSLAYVYCLRTYFKNIQKQAIFSMRCFIDTSQRFDIIINRTLSLIQEVELVSRGYLTFPLPPITRIEANSQDRRCKMLRLLLSTLLSQILSSYNHSFSLLRTFYSKREFDTLQIMYNLPHSQDFDSLPSYFKEDDSNGLPYLKALFYTIHEKRRQCLVSLLSMSISSFENISSWKVVISQLKGLSVLMNNFHDEIEKALENNEQILELSIPKTNAHEKNIKWNGHIRNINVLFQVLRRFQAKLHILKEESNRLIQDDFDENVKDELLSYYDFLKDDLKILTEKWESGRDYLLKIPTKPNIMAQDSICLDSKMSEDSNTSIHDSNESDSDKSISEIKNTKALSEITNDWDVSSTSYSQHLSGGTLPNNNEKEVVFEAVSDKFELTPRLQKLNKAERIEKIKRDREKRLKIRKDREVGMKVVSELKDVLGKRRIKMLNNEN